MQTIRLPHPRQLRVSERSRLLLALAYLLTVGQTQRLVMMWFYRAPAAVRTDVRRKLPFTLPHGCAAGRKFEAAALLMGSVHREEQFPPIF